MSDYTDYAYTPYMPYVTMPSYANSPSYVMRSADTYPSIPGAQPRVFNKHVVHLQKLIANGNRFYLSEPFSR